jgi:hypothetical protein
VITHYHGDHFGGAITLANLLPIKNLYDNGKFENMPDDPGKAYFDLKAENKHVVNQAPPSLTVKRDNRRTAFSFLGGKRSLSSAGRHPENFDGLLRRPREGARRLRQRQQRRDGRAVWQLAVL